MPRTLHPPVPTQTPRSLSMMDAFVQQRDSLGVIWCAPTQYAECMTDPAPEFPKGIGAPATRALVGAGYTKLSELADVPASDLKKLHGMGPKALRILQEALEESGRSLG